MKKESSFKMKGFGGFGNESSPIKKGRDGIPHTGYGKKFDPSKHVVDFKKGVAHTPEGKININVDKVSKKPASYGSRATRNARNFAKANMQNVYTAAGRAMPRAKFKKAKGKIGRKVAGKLGSKLLGPIGVGLAIKDAVGTYKDIKKGMKPGKAARKNFLGF